MQNLLRPFRGAPVHFCSGVLRTPSGFLPARMQQDSPADAGQQYPAVTDRRYSTADERSRARKGADGRDSGRRSQVSTTHTGAQWTARPTDSLRLWADWSAAILAAVPLRRVKFGRGFFRPGRYRAVAAPVRARETKFNPIGWAKCERLRRAVECAPYLNSVPQRLCGSMQPTQGRKNLLSVGVKPDPPSCSAPGRCGTALRDGARALRTSS